jgi:hypothetical protein
VRPGQTSSAALALLTALGLLGGSAGAADYVQFRYFAPPLDLSGVQFDGQYSVRTAALNLSLRVPELSLRTQSASLSLSSGGAFGAFSVSRDTARQGATYTALVGYSAPEPGLFSDATLTYVRAEDWRPEGYLLNSVSVDARGRFSPSWKWNASGGLDNTKVNAAPNDPGTSRSLNFGVQGKVAKVDLKARARFGSSDTGKNPNTLKWTANVDAAAPITDRERLAGAVSYNSAGKDTESVTLSSTRFAPLTVSASLSRADQTFSARLSAAYAVSEALNLGAEYGLGFTAPLSQDGSVSLDYTRDAWTVSAGVAADTSQDVNDALTYSVSPRVSVSYAGGGFTASLRGNARYSPLPEVAGATTSPGSLPPQAWSYHLDASAQTLSGPLIWGVSLSADSPTSKNPLSAEVAVQALYAISEHWKLSANARYRLGKELNSLQGGVGVRYEF